MTNQKRRIEDQRPGQPLEWDETDYLLGSPANAAHLGKSIDQASKGVPDEAIGAAYGEMDAHLADGAGESVNGYGNWHKASEREFGSGRAPTHGFKLPATVLTDERSDREIMEEWDRHYLKGKENDTPFLRTVVEFARAIEAEVLAQAGVRAEPTSQVLAIPSAIMALSADQRQHAEYLRGFRDAKHEAADLVLARADELAALAASTTPAQVPAAEVRAVDLPAILFDGKAVYDELLGRSSRTSAENVADVLDAVVRLMRKGGADKASELRADDSRYPYTYAADYLRMQIGDDYGKGLISRSAASQARTLVAKAIGLPDAHVANKLADAYLAAAPSTADSGNTGALGEGAGNAA